MREAGRSTHRTIADSELNSSEMMQAIWSNTQHINIGSRKKGEKIKGGEKVRRRIEEVRRQQRPRSLVGVNIKSCAEELA